MSANLRSKFTSGTLSLFIEIVLILLILAYTDVEINESNRYKLAEEEATVGRAVGSLFPW